MDHVTSCNLPNSDSAPRQQEQVELPTEEDPLMAPARVTTSSKTPEIEQSNDSVVEEHEPPLHNSDTVELKRSSTQTHRPLDWLM